jgi:hypothetical protein
MKNQFFEEGGSAVAVSWIKDALKIERRLGYLGIRNRGISLLLLIFGCEG